MKNNFRKAALSTICMLIVAVMSLTGVTYAWFTAGTTATVNGMQMQVSAADGGVQVSALTASGWTNYAATVDLDTTLEEVKPVSSVNGLNFFQLDVNPSDSTKVHTVVATGNNVMTERIKLKNPGAEDIIVVLNATNTLITDATAEGLIATEIEKAARVAIILTDENGNPLTDEDEVAYIWAPADTSYTGISAAKEDAWLDLSNGFLPVVSGVSATVNITAAGSCEIELPGIDEAGTETEVFVTIVVWIEGQDADCVNMNAGGSFDIQLQFEVKP